MVLIITIITKPEDVNLIYSTLMLLAIPFVTLSLLKFMNSQVAGNFFSISTIVVMALGTGVFIYPPLPEINFVQGMYMMLASLTFSLLFSSKKVLIINAVLILVTNFWYANTIINMFGESEIAKVASVNFPVALIIITVVVFYGKKFTQEAIVIAEESAKKTLKQNLKLEELFGSVKETSKILETLSDEIKSSSNQINSSNSKQAANVEEVSTAIEEVVNSIIQNAEHSKQTSDLARSTSRLSQKSIGSIQKSLLANKEISKKIELVNDIAFKTNLLALNAAIEASHAGIAGRGFSVVASEIKKLSLHSKKSANEIIKLISESINVSDTADINLKNIISKIKQSAEYSSSISEALAEQEVSVRHINAAMEDINRSAQNNAAVSESLASNIELLSSQSDKLNKILSA